jgi:hypothetical protein
MKKADPYTPEEFQRLLKLFEARGAGYVERRLVATILELSDELEDARLASAALEAKLEQGDVPYQTLEELQAEADLDAMIESTFEDGA